MADFPDDHTALDDDDLEPIDKITPSAPHDALNMAALLRTYSESFDKLCSERDEAGAAEYGKFTFLQNDVVRMMMEELADTANYCRMQFIKLMMLQHMLEADEAIAGTSTDEIQIGTNAFKGTGEVGWH